MASAQVLSNAVGSSRKQGHLEAGKRRLEEFRKKKEAAKKTASTSHSHIAKSTAYEKQASENGVLHHINQVSPTANGRSETAKASGFLNNDDKSVDLQQTEPKQERNSSDISSLNSKISFGHPRQTDDRVGNVGPIGEGMYADGISSFSSAIDDKISYYPKLYGAGDSFSRKDVISHEILQNMNVDINDTAASVYPEGNGTDLRCDYVRSTADLPTFVSEPSRGQHVQPDLKNNLRSGVKETNTVNSAGNLSTFYNHQASEPHPVKSRMSFIDSLNTDRDSRAPGWSSSEKPASAPVDPPPKPTSSPSISYFGNAYREQNLFSSFESKLESSSVKQNESFAALEQHIEDLTQEKYSLQRALDASKSLAESLASENSSLTESYNQQQITVAQLKDEMERLQGEIKARLVELESIKAEYTNVEFECNAADEHAKLLASEVIGLEEKALRLRSNELKLEKELENSSAEIASYKRKLSSLGKERQDMVQTIDALREEKKLMQSKLRRASGSGVLVDMNRRHLKKDASTCTNDLDLNPGEADKDNSEQFTPDLHEYDGSDNSGVEDAATTIPSDQVQMILIIDSLISEIRAEKDELVKALATERSTNTKLKDSNKDLSRKLESQTQRLELLVSKSMASENVLATQPIQQENVAYADEGDEVVERVLGWIMKIFPEGSSKRRTSRL